MSEEKIKGVTNFWFNVLDTHPGLSSLIAEEDIPLLEKLNDISVEYSENYETFTLAFHFDDNEFITNKVRNSCTSTHRPTHNSVLHIYLLTSIISCRERMTQFYFVLLCFDRC